MFPIENGECSIYSLLSGTIKRIRIHYGLWTLIEVHFNDVDHDVDHDVE